MDIFKKKETLLQHFMIYIRMKGKKGEGERGTDNWNYDRDK